MTHKQRLFLHYYVHSANATEAAIKAGYSRKTAYQMGHENLKKPEIREAIMRWISAHTSDIDLLKTRSILRLMDYIVMEVVKPADVANQLRAIDLLFKYAENFPQKPIESEKSVIDRLIKNAKEFEAKCMKKKM